MMKLFYGLSNPDLGREIAKKLDQEPGKLKIQKFANDETFVQLLENVRGKNVFLMQTAVAPINDNFMELLIMIDAAKRASADKIIVITPNYFYSRQDRKSGSREPITAKLVADQLTIAGATRLITLDLHSDQIQGFFNIPMDNLPTSQLFMKRATEMMQGNNPIDFVVVSPDGGAVKKSSKIAASLGTGLAVINKMRTEPNKASVVADLPIMGTPVKNKTCFIFDDMIDTGGSLFEATRTLKKHKAKGIYAFITHGIFSNDAWEKLGKSEINKLIVTNSIPLRIKSERVEVLSVADYLAKAILRVNNDKSVSVLFHNDGKEV